MRNDDSDLLDTTTGLVQEGRAWLAKLPARFGAGDSLDASTASRLVLYEDDRELGPSHAQHETIRQDGGGAYSHWHDTLYFSTSDGSNPRENHRKYRIALRSLRVVVIALDGVDPQTLRHHIADGRLPAIAKILERSREVAFQTECHLFAASCWPGLASGLSVGSHGIHAFRPLRSGTMELVESDAFPMPLPFWEIAARAGISTCVLDMPHYRTPVAADNVKKLQYVQWAPHPAQNPPTSSTPDLIARLISRHGFHPCPADIEELPTTQDSADHLACLCAGARKRAAIINDLIRIINPELLVAAFSEPHTAGHQWLNREAPDHRCYDPALVQALGSPTRQVYQAVDEAIGKVIELLPPETTVVLTFLGGMRVTHGASYLLHDLLVRLGHLVYPTYQGDGRSWREVLKLTGSAWRGRRDASTSTPAFEGPPGLLLDWSKTRAFVLPWAHDGYLRLNQRGREPYGVVSDGAERERVLGQIEAAVHSLRLSGTNEPAAKAVIRTQEQFSGTASAELPDLMIVWNNDRPFDAVESESVGRIENRDPSARAGHGNQGGLLAYGPLVAAGPPIEGARDFDIGPTILRLLGVEVPSRVDGSAISELASSGPSNQQ